MNKDGGSSSTHKVHFWSYLKDSHLGVKCIPWGIRLELFVVLKDICSFTNPSLSGTRRVGYIDRGVIPFPRNY